MNRFSLTVLIAALFTPALAAYGQSRTLTILHTNDLHASFLPHDAFWIQSNPKPLVGGFKELWWTVDSIRKAKGDTPLILLDGGDVMTGSPISEIEYKGSYGGALFEMLNGLGYDAWTIGNHDLDISQENLRQHTKIVKFPTLSANLRDSADNLAFNNLESAVITKGGVKVGVIGFMTKDLFSVTNTANLHGVKVIPPVEIAQRLIDKLSGEADLVIALTHEGVEDDSVLAVATHGLQVIIGGHSHTRLKSPKLVNGVIICQAGSNAENLGELELTIEQKKVTKYDGKLISLWTRSSYPENSFTKMVDDYKAMVDRDYGEVLGQLVGDWKRDGRGESGIGNFVADATREAAGADIGVANSSGIRKDLSAGPIRKQDLFEISPFRNVLCTFSLTGKDVRGIVQRHVNALADGKGSLQISGITCTWKRENSVPVVTSVNVGGKPLKDEASYTCATNDFIVNQADKYLGLKPASVTYTPTTMLQTLIDKVKKEKTLHSQVENRMQESR